MHDLYLSYTGRKTYLTCPLRYWFRYVKKQEVPEDPRKTLFGLAMGKIFEWFYNKQLWAHPDPETKCLEVSDSAIDLVLDGKKFDSSAHPAFMGELRRDVRKFVPHAVRSIRNHKLLTPSSRSEVDLTVNSSKDGLTLRLGGRADFVHGPRPVWIIDGKGSAHRERFLDSEQLVWYALLHYLKHHVAPLRVGFLHYRFPDDPVQWVLYGESDMRATFEKTFSTARLILDNRFDASPSNECHRCDFRMLCSDGTKHLASRRAAGGGRIGSTMFDLENVT